MQLNINSALASPAWLLLAGCFGFAGAFGGARAAAFCAVAGVTASTPQPPPSSSNSSYRFALRLLLLLS